MKHIFLLFVSLLAVSQLQAQDYTPPKDTTRTLHEVGVNGTFFVANFLTFSGNIPVSVDPYALQYKVLFKGKDGPRFGFGANYRLLDQSVDQDIDKAVTTNINMRLGYEHRIRIAKKWKVYVGLDALWAMERAATETKTDFQHVKIKDLTETLGAGAVFGIQFFATKRISMGTEMSAQLLFNENIQHTAVVGSLPTVTEDKFKENTFNFMLPTSIYVNIALGKQK